MESMSTFYMVTLDIVDTVCTESTFKVSSEGSTVVSCSNGIDTEGTHSCFLKSRTTLGKVGLSSH